MSAGLRAGTNNDGYLQINGTDVLTALSSGSVGIGTTNPVCRLQAQINTTAFINGDTLNSYRIARFMNLSSDGSARGLEIGAPTGSVTSPVYLKVTSTGSRFSLINQSDIENFTVLNSGNVGIGVTNPTSKLEAVGTISSTGSTSPTGTGLVFGDNSSGGYKWIQSFNSQPLVINPLGNFIGIGTTSPGTILDIHRSVSANVGPEVRLTNFAGTANDKARVSFYGGLSGSTTLRGALDFNIHTSGTSELIWSSGEVTVTERFRINQTGDVTISNGNLIIGTGGKGIDFSATANSSGTMSSELFNDYEEGTWTPTMVGLSNTPIYDNRFGRYTKIGRMVHIMGILQINSGGLATFTNGNDQFVVSGLPYACSTNTVGYVRARGIVQGQNFQYNGSFNDYSTTGQVSPGFAFGAFASTGISFFVTGSGQGAIRGTVRNSSMTNAFIIEWDLTYLAD